ncbi:MAG TPA: ribose 5-phosphate isomerase A [Candidatus Dormibacteraeota bacterium]|nr:ribose 5-phosphate isomerase A [Candidatus Dormibacteraeota bacterium]
MDSDVAAERDAASNAAADLLEADMRVGLGTGSTVGHLLAAIARRKLPVRCVATSPRTEAAARQLGIAIEPFTGLDRLDLAIDGADQIAPDGWLVKGGGAAHTREKLVATTAERFVVIADSTKLVARLHGPVPVELLEFGIGSTLRRLGMAVLRDVPKSPDGGVIADVDCALDDPGAVASWLSATPGVIEHGLFPPDMVTMALVGCGREVRELRF